MAKYCYWDEKNKVYRIRRRIKGKLTHFGTYPNEKEAALAVELYEKTGWNKKDNWKIKAKVKEIIEIKQGCLKNGSC